MTTMYERCAEETDGGQKCLGQRKFIVATSYGSLPLCRSHATGYAEWRAEGLPKQMTKWFELTVTCHHETVMHKFDDVNELETMADEYREYEGHYSFEINVCDFRGQKIRLFPF